MVVVSLLPFTMGYMLTMVIRSVIDSVFIRDLIFIPLMPDWIMLMLRA